MENTNLRILELFSGIGGMHYAAELAGICYEVLLSLDINTSANEVYRYNFPQTNQLARNIESLSTVEISKLMPNAILMSPPCQPFTRVGNKLDVKDPRCSAFLHLVDILPHLQSVNYILMENVVGFECSEMRQLFIESLKSSGMWFREFLLSPESLGIPNSRTRYYLLARKTSDFPFSSENEIVKNLPSCCCNDPPSSWKCLHCKKPTLISPEKQQGKALESYLETLVAEDMNAYLLPEKVLSKYGQILDIRHPLDSSSCCFTKAYSHYAEGTGSVLQQNSSESTEERYSKFQESGDIEHLKLLQLRYFTPKEVSNLMGFPNDFGFPESTSIRTRYRLLGNSLNVVVVANLLRLLAY